ncbi:MAG: DNA mismatch repair endonuclease MutL [Lachnospiraceae bacterium]|nr:DNA mismatch repair endonuclease MutL [Lachnospiraceae bacterium]
MIKVLDQETINKIAAGEVIDRPSSVAKELIENAIDAGATAITVEIKEGGLSFMRITDNGGGISKEDVPTAFIRHATSKIMTIEDLLSVSSLGFRGEALASIAAVSQVECITKTPSDLTGLRYEIHGGKEIASEEIGAPTGTTIIVRNLFYNVPARKKFVKTPTTEGGYITDLVTKLALSKPEISFKYIINGSNKIATSGNGKLQDVIYHIYGKDISANLIPIKRSVGNLSVEGYIGKSFVSKGNRGFEHYFVNGRAIRSNIVTKAIEEGYKSFIMIHRFPFTALHFTMDSEKLDVNVHPQKMEFKYSDNEQLFDFVKDTVRQALLQPEMIQDMSLRTAKEQKAITIERQKRQTANVPEPFENKARALKYNNKINKELRNASQNNNVSGNGLHNKDGISDDQNISIENSQGISAIKITKQSNELFDKNVNTKYDELVNTNANKPSDELIDTNKQYDTQIIVNTSEQDANNPIDHTIEQDTSDPINHINKEQSTVEINGQAIYKAVQQEEAEASVQTGEQLSMPVEEFISPEARKKHRLIGQVFKTYWLIEFDNKLYIMDQHAAHEKVMFEHLMKMASEKKVLSQQLMPPKVVHIDSAEHNLLNDHIAFFEQTGFEIEDFGDDAIVLRAVPDDIMGVDPQLLFDELINVLKDERGKLSVDFFVEKLSGMACKAAIKGNTEISFAEANELLDEMMTLDNPYNCPHGRPTMISLTKTEVERKFKRIQDNSEDEFL